MQGPSFVVLSMTGICGCTLCGCIQNAVWQAGVLPILLVGMRCTNTLREKGSPGLGCLAEVFTEACWQFKPVHVSPDDVAITVVLLKYSSDSRGSHLFESAWRMPYCTVMLNDYIQVRGSGI